MNMVQFIREVRAEIHKVSWPTREEVVKMTSLVIIVSFVVGAYIGVIDVAFAKVIETIVQ